MSTPVLHDLQYLDILEELVHLAEKQHNSRQDRTGVGTTSVFSRTMRFNISDGTIPLLTSKKMYIPAIIHELLWYLSGDTNIKYLQEHGVRIWDEWADEEGNLGPVYGQQWRKWKKTIGARIDYSTDPPEPIIDYDEIDQLGQAVDLINNNPHSRRILVNAWNVGELDDMNLPPCHYTYQFYVDNQDRVSCMMNQRSADIFLGVPFNIAQYSMLTSVVAHLTGKQPGEFIWVGGDVHLYSNHIDQAKEQLSREWDIAESPFLTIRNTGQRKLEDYQFDDFIITGYNPLPTIKAPVAV